MRYTACNTPEGRGFRERTAGCEPRSINLKPTMKKLITILAALAVTTMFTVAAEGDKKPAGDTAKPAAEGAAKEGAKGEKKAVDKDAQFKKLDTDGDGKLSLDELKAGPMGKKAPEKCEALIKAKDKDGDGKLSLEEFKAEGGKKKNK